MLKIKSHSRQFSHQDLSSGYQDQQNLKFFLLSRNKNDPLMTKYAFKNCPKEVKLSKESKRNRHKTMEFDHIKVNFCTTQPNNSGQKVLFRGDMKKYNLEVKQLGRVLAEVSKQIANELQKNKLLGSILRLMQMELQSEHSSADSEITKLQKKKVDQIDREKKTIQKVLNEKNKTISQQKKLLEEIENERKIRLIYEKCFYALENQIHKHQLIYKAELTRTVDNKFLYLIMSTNDIISNGHILTLRKEDEKQNEKDFLKNSYMCIPKMENEKSMAEEENDRKVKSTMVTGKKKTAKKLVKIMNFIAISKALQSEQLQLYEQEENYEKQKEIMEQYLRPIIKRGTTYKQNMNSRSVKSIFARSAKSLLGTKACPIEKPGYRQMISLKFIPEAKEFFQAQFNSSIYELFKIYCALGINIFAKKQTNFKEGGERLQEDYFTYDQDRLVQQSERRLEYVRKSEGKMAKFNDLLEKKIQLVQQNITQTEGFITEMEKQLKQKQQKTYEQPDQSQEAQPYSDEFIYHNVFHLLGVNPLNQKAQKQIQSLIGKLLSAQKQSQHSAKHQSLELMPQNQQHSIDSTNSQQQIQSRQSLPTLTSFVEKKRGNYSKEKIKIQAHQSKFTPLTVNGEVSNHNSYEKTPVNRTCRSIFQNGMKSLDNLLENMNTCQSYQRVLQRSEFEKEYSKEITKKKRVMFRRQAKVIPYKSE